MSDVWLQFCEDCEVYYDPTDSSTCELGHSDDSATEVLVSLQKAVNEAIERQAQARAGYYGVTAHALPYDATESPTGLYLDTWL